MDTTVDEIADGIFRISVFVPHPTSPLGFTFNHFLIRDEEPLLFHCGKRRMFPLVSEAVAHIIPVERLRWLTFGHFESDECGSLNEWLAVAPHADPMHGRTGCNVSVADFADRPPRTLADGETVVIGRRRIRYLDTPHVPHGWDAGVIYEETTGTLFCGDLFAHYGRGPAVTETDIIEPAISTERATRSTSLGPTTAPTIRKLAALKPQRLALMHGSSFVGDGAKALTELAGYFDERLREELSAQV